MPLFDWNQADVRGHIAELWVYPIKSCAGIALPQARLLPTGLEWDRAWMLVDPQGHFLTQRELPRMARVQPVLEMAKECLRVQFPGLPDLELPLAPPLLAPQPQCRVTVWSSQVLAWDAGDEAARWFSHALGCACRLVRFDPAQQRLSNKKWTGGIAAPNQFADGYPLLVTTAAAVRGLNRRLQHHGHGPVEGLRFRANLVLDGLEAHEEDFIETLWFQADAALALRLGKPCSRCPIPNIDPRTGQSSPEVLQMLAQYRADPRLDGALTFGMNACVAHGAGNWLHRGQSVGAQLKFAD